MDTVTLHQVIAISQTMAEWRRLIDLIDLASDSIDNKKSASKLKTVSDEVFGDIAPLGTFEVSDD